MWAVPVIHPAATFPGRNPTALGPLEAHVNGFIRRVIEGFPPDPWIWKEPDLPRLDWFLQRCRKDNLGIGTDIETRPPRGGRPEWAKLASLAELRVVGVGANIDGLRPNGDPFEGLGLSWFWPMKSAIYFRLRDMLADYGIRKVFCNGWAFDIPVLERYKLRVR